jgi:hypothetical protein
MSSNTPTTVDATIWVYKGALGLDWSEKRHTLLAFTLADGTDPIVIHAAGSPRDYRVEVLENYDPSKSRHVVGNVEVGKLLVQVSKAQLVDFVSQTPVNNTVDDWNCQNWVGDAMERMLNAGWITNRIYHNGLDTMADIVTDAKDEHLR